MRTNEAPTNYPSVFLSANQIWWLAEKNNSPISESQVRVKVKVMLENKRGAAHPERIAPMRNMRCELVSGEDVSFLVGKLKTLIDASISEKDQNKAMKDMTRLIVWDWFTFITDHTLDHLGDKKKWYTKNKKLVK